MNHQNLPATLVLSSLLLLTIAFTPIRAQVPRPDFQDVEYARIDDSTSLLLDIYLPGVASEPYPVIVWIHGGAWQSGSKGPGRWTFMLDREYALVSITYRLTDRAVFPAQIHDCKGAIRWIRAHAEEYGFDPDRIGVFGSSAGGHLVAMLGTSGDVPDLEGEIGGNLEYSSRVQAVADWFGPSNLLSIVDYPSTLDHGARNSPEGKLIGGTIAENQDRAWAASPIAYVSSDDSPFLIQHGTEDMTVPFHQSLELDSALREAGVDVTFRPVVGGGHGAGFDADSVEKEVIDFFARTLSGSSSALQERIDPTAVEPMQLSPVPADDYVALRFLDPESRYHVQLANMLGETVYEGTLGSGERIDLTNVAAGVYVLKGVVDREVVGKLFVIDQK